MKKKMYSSANFRATVTVLAISVAITAMIRKYTK